MKPIRNFNQFLNQLANLNESSKASTVPAILHALTEDESSWQHLYALLNRARTADSRQLNQFCGLKADEAEELSNAINRAMQVRAEGSVYSPKFVVIDNFLTYEIAEEDDGFILIRVYLDDTGNVATRVDRERDSYRLDFDPSELVTGDHIWSYYEEMEKTMWMSALPVQGGRGSGYKVSAIIGDEIHLKQI